VENLPLPVKGEFLAQRVEIKHVYDLRTFLPHQIKEVEQWSHRKMKNEKWLVQLDCKTGKLKKWKLTD